MAHRETLRKRAAAWIGAARKRAGVPAIAGLALLLAGVGRGASQGVVDDYPHGEFREDCALCHLPDAWSPARIDADFDHSSFGWPLEGAHDGVRCLMCHLTLEFRETTGSVCADCHQDVHLGELGPDCNRCHSTRTFVDRADEVRAHRMTRFPLTGVHVSLDCVSCHTPVGSRFATFANTPTSCGECHAAAYQAARSPDHVAGGFSLECANCHTMFTWSSSDFDHALTGFPLTGAHQLTACARCHEGSQFAGTPSDCFSCHQLDFAAAADPSHTGFPTDCASCHSTASWEGAAFDHAFTGFPLTGAHQVATCTQCHAAGYAGTPTDCYACHQLEYQATSNPDHQSSGFGTDCAACHSTSSWQGATFGHDPLFPLRGPHDVSCAQCHTVPADFGVFDCLGCHAHRQSEMDDKHREENGYSYDSQACYRCHPRGRH